MLFSKGERKTLCEGQKQTQGQGQISKVAFRQVQIQKGEDGRHRERVEILNFFLVK